MFNIVSYSCSRWRLSIRRLDLPNTIQSAGSQTFPTLGWLPLVWSDFQILRKSEGEQINWFPSRSLRANDEISRDVIQTSLKILQKLCWKAHSRFLLRCRGLSRFPIILLFAGFVGKPLAAAKADSQSKLSSGTCDSFHFNIWRIDSTTMMITSCTTLTIMIDKNLPLQLTKIFKVCRLREKARFS